MNRSAVISILIVLLFTTSITPAFPSAAGETRKSTKIRGKEYVSINDAALLLGATKFWKVETRKAVLNVEGKGMRFTVGSPVVAVGDRTFQVIDNMGLAYYFIEVLRPPLEGKNCIRHELNSRIF